MIGPAVDRQLLTEALLDNVATEFKLTRPSHEALHSKMKIWQWYWDNYGVDIDNVPGLWERLRELKVTT